MVDIDQSRDLVLQISQWHISHITYVLRHYFPLFLIDLQKLLHLVLSSDWNYHLPSLGQLLQQSLRHFLSSCSHMNHIKHQTFLRPAQPSIAFFDGDLGHQFGIALRDVFDRLAYQFWHMLNSVYSRLGWDDQGHSCCQIASSTSDIKHIFGSFEAVVKILQGVGVHVRGGNRRTKADALRTVFVWMLRGIEASIYKLHDFAYFFVLDHALIHQGKYQFFVSLVHLK